MSTAARDVQQVGIQPWFPWPLSRWRWWTEAIPAERVAALRIATALVLLFDLLFTYWPHFHTLFSPEALGGRDLFAGKFRSDHYFWSVLRWLPDTGGPVVVLAVWTASAVGLLVGWRPLLCGVVAWVCAVSVWNITPGAHNGGDRLRHTLLLMVAVSQAGAVWGLHASHTPGERRRILVPGWPVKILFVQLAALYFFSGYYKLLSPIWRNGYVMYWASHDLYWSLYPEQATWIPVAIHRLTAQITLIWELGFPVLAVLPTTRVPTLVLGLVFHIGTLVTLEVGCFALYSMACYTAFAPWERWREYLRGATANPSGATADR
ncbi:MAG: HTTM domain-containing protein [Gemmataceae bacterium]|nr:HTTM domain-containing protein [Gemmata sp.]MDW8197142.1 HTTM domain-containing protein [Gemmataceae bacterium]